MLDDCSKDDRLNTLSLLVRNCKKCDLFASRINAVPGTGDSDATIMFVGEAPGQKEDVLGEPFVGSAGKLLTGLLNEIDMSRDAVFITNIVKCRPPDNRDPLRLEIAQCQSYLRQQISMINPLLIIPLGRFAMNYFMPGESITQIAGRVHHMNGMNIYPLLHPAAALRRTEFKNRLREDFLRIPITLAKLLEEDISTENDSSNEMSSI